jgi:hypothetical protein
MPRAIDKFVENVRDSRVTGGGRNSIAGNDDSVQGDLN